MNKYEVEVTDCRVKLIDSTMRAKAMASVVLNNAIKINDIRVIEGKDGLFIAMPSRKLEDGSFKDIAHPINQEVRDKIEYAVLEVYKNSL